MQHTETPSSSTRTRSRLSLLVLFGIFVSPVVIAWLVFYVFPDWRPTGTVNYGQLVAPVRPLPDFSLDTIEGKTIDKTFFRGKWTFMYLRQGDCDDACVKQLYNIRQIRLAQGKNIDRLQRLMLWDMPAVSAGESSKLQERFPGQVIARIETVQDLTHVFAIDESDPWLALRIYLIDPLGNLMMSYEPGSDPKGVIEDLERLLKYSGLG